MRTVNTVEIACTPEQRLIMAMLAAAGDVPIWGDPKGLVSDVDWARFCVAADGMIKPYLSWACGQPQFEALIPTSVKLQLAAAQTAARIRNLRWAAELRQIIATFRANGVSLAFVKGAVQQRTVYPDPSARPMSDVDLVVRREEMPLVHDALTGLGFQSRTSVEAQLPAEGLAANEEACFLKRVGDASLILEVHTKLEKSSGYVTPDWGACIDLQGGDGVLIPSVDLHAALRHMCFHLARHGFEHGLMWLLDIRLFVERYGNTIRWQDFVDECEPEARPLLAFILTLAGDWFGAEIPDHIRQVLPADKYRAAAPLAWGQLWHRQVARKPLNLVTVLLSGDPLRIVKYFRDRVRRSTAPIPGRDTNRFVLAMHRFGADLKFVRARLRGGGFKLSSIRGAQDSDRRLQRLRQLLWPPE